MWRVRGICFCITFLNIIMTAAADGRRSVVRQQGMSIQLVQDVPSGVQQPADSDETEIVGLTCTAKPRTLIEIYGGSL
jgi:hypothetical protein